MKLSKCSKEQFINSITSQKEDSFAKTFVAKANMQNQWGYCIGAFDDEENLMGAIICTISKRSPKVANLQLLHTFHKFRKQGVARKLTNYCFIDSLNRGALYFRVSAEPGAVAFYEAIGFKFWGKQKSGCSLSMFRIVDDEIKNGVYDVNDVNIKNALFSGRKGSLANSYEKETNEINLKKFIL